MIAKSILPITVLALLSSCAGHWDRSYKRWSALQNGNGPMADWAHCIDLQSNEYLSSINPKGPPIWFKGQLPAEDHVIFTWVLADCAHKMAGSDWNHRQPEDYQRLIIDAFQHFTNVAIGIRADEDAGII